MKDYFQAQSLLKDFGVFPNSPKAEEVDICMRIVL